MVSTLCIIFWISSLLFQSSENGIVKRWLLKKSLNFIANSRSWRAYESLILTFSFSHLAQELTTFPAPYSTRKVNRYGLTMPRSLTLFSPRSLLGLRKLFYIRFRLVWVKLCEKNFFEIFGGSCTFWAMLHICNIGFTWLQIWKIQTH